MNKPTPEYLDEEIVRGKHIDKYPEEELGLLLTEIRRVLEEYTGFPPDEVPRWVDFDIAIKEILAKVKQHYEQRIEEVEDHWRRINIELLGRANKDIEEAKREEKEKMYYWLSTEWKDIDNKTATYYRSKIDKFFGKQALKEEQLKTGTICPGANRIRNERAN